MNICRVNGIGKIYLEMLLPIRITHKIIMGSLCILDEYKEIYVNKFSIIKTLNVV